MQNISVHFLKRLRVMEKREKLQNNGKEMYLLIIYNFIQ